jgi:hypothetical protein
MSKVFKSIGNAVSGVVRAVTKVVSSVVKAVVNVVSSVINFVVQPFMGMLGGMPSMPDASSEADRQQGVLVQTQGSNINVPIVYGYRKVGGTVVFAETGSTNNRYLYVAYVFSEGLVEGLREVFIDDWQLPVNLTGALNGGQVVDVNADRYNGRVRLQWYPGQFFSNPASSPVGAAVKAGIFAEAPSFRDTMDFNGLAVLFARYEWKEIRTQEDSDNNPFSGNIPAIQVSMLGVRVASLLVAAEQTEYETAPVRYSTNPAEILLDYLRNPRYGKGLRNADIHWPTFKATARKCNQTVTYLTGGGITGPILTCNTVVPTDQTIFANVKTMLMGFRAYMPYVQGKYKLKIEDAGNEYDILSGAAVIYQTFTKDDMIGDVTYTGIERSSKYNVVAVSYVDPDQKFSVQQVIYPETEVERQIYIDRDGGRENKLETTFPTITNYAIAKDMARLLFNKSRRQETCSITVTSRALELEPGDNIRIQSNILNFGTDPWRIVSFKLNDDMSVELGCVRNPDDIYPYVRVGEEDYVIPLYVPRGSIIYYPNSENRLPLGLLPPTHAVFPDEYSATPTHPPATDPDGPGGGGPGGGNPPDIGPGPVIPPDAPVETPPIEAPPTTPVPPINNPPAPVPEPPPFDAVLAFRSVVYNRNDATSGIFTINFTQPDAGLYDYAIFWWRPNQFTNWTSVRLDTKPGPGGQISTTVGPLSNLGQYDYYVRAYATDNRASANVTSGNFRAVQSQTQVGELLGIGSGSTLAVTAAWAPPASQVPTTPVYDDNIDFLEIRPRLTAGAPQNPRRLSITMTQLLYTFTAPVNPLIEGIYVYYKYRDDAFWTREELLIPANKSVIETVSWDLAGDFGTPAFPVSALGNPTAFQQYDFVVRLKYRDGTTALKQLGTGRGLVEQSGTPPFVGAYNFPVFGTDPTATASVRSTSVPAGFELPLADQQDPARVYNTGQDLLPNFFRIRSSPTESKIFFFFNPPSNSRFRGYRIRYRPVVPGSDPDFITLDVPTTVGQDGKIFYELNSNYSHSTKFEWMISALYRDNAGLTQDANNCFYCRAQVGTQPSGTELLNAVFNFETKDSRTTLGEITDAFPAVATIVPQRWVKKQTARFVSTDGTFIGTAGDSLRGGQEIRRDSTGQPRLNSWFELTFQAPNQTFTSLIVYRRVFAPSGAARTSAGTVAKYYNLGAWEKVVIARANLTHQGSGVYTTNVRGPISFNAFNSNPTGALFKSIYGPTGSYPGAGYPSTLLQLSQMYPYFGVGNGRLEYTAEYLFVLDDSGEGTQGCRLTDFYTDFAGVTSAGFRTEVDGIQSANQPRDDYRLLSDFNGFDAGFRRNLNEALTDITVQQMTTSDFGNGAPKLNANFNGYTFYLANPVGITVY